MGEAEELQKRVDMLRELGDDWKENMAILNARENGETLCSLKRLFKENKRNSLFKIGIACLAFPEPIVSDVLGYGLLAAGLIQMRIKNSALYLEDISKVVPRLFKELHQVRQEIV